TAGCGSGLAGLPMTAVHGDPSVRVIVKTDPPGAVIKVDGKDIGTSPVSFSDPSGGQQTFMVEARKDGYEPIIRTITRQWDSMRLTYRLDPVYYYTLTALSGGPPAVTAKSDIRDLPTNPVEVKLSDVDQIPAHRKKERDAVALVIGISKYRDSAI